MGPRLLGFALLGIAIVTTFGVWYLSSDRSEIPLVFSPVQMIGATWERYKENYLEKDTRRTIDRGRGDVTTSEGQSYTMLRAVWMGDKETFDASHRWSKDNLWRREDRLLAWLFGKRSDGTWGILASEGGYNAASDADTDTALALIFAYARWQDDTYLGDALAMLDSIWEKEVIEVRSRPYLAANNLEKFSGDEWALINPSYFNPAAYRIFAKIDPSHPWETLVESSYDLLERGMESPLQGGKSAVLPPDWLLINKSTGELAAPGRGLTTNFGYDALRSPWRLALDIEWFGSPRARELLQKMSALSANWERDRSLVSIYTHQGAPASSVESPALYGGVLGHFMEKDPKMAEEVYRQKLQYLFDPGRNDWKERLSYYDDNWAWLGIALYNRLLPNLAAPLIAKGTNFVLPHTSRTPGFAIPSLSAL
ncbi:hypothetical protein A2852_01885 [Candidatus Adlerbacteria bacterium RIFCSPHIGHO2_01_FULL_54_23]|uniref:Glucanase n=3 Tax=Candidatus Adleribacteriota TaxID=1752736 RepID=A0A1F4XZ83_9BACT|nr:MAG: Glycoside hydrolase family 8 [Candidatus Adlerbacteria bacterium GW2011_GWA1_54_10]KKW36116.1 MAG: Glycoside hydrolase family 8 [Candidatus Adlerbacteria bacterium GW2011_GWA2_54_12]KKW37430.1 MAG: Glycoside hydrolase family 8 [Candidatus Adlerbacteria bacterium GW2011_GWB1_54_7]OGC79082.1 MAG: hypothetical protein A2852_01885 [Candidatus Adlerbacteria bacterium RIFCSPHIGHO2_01_FULL_54_23]OGC87012.1 MAG: hypothetical protein A3B33_02960 [Candidatus Adlerbacteria bacterium RIFCSPLOWO2_01